MKRAETMFKLIAMYFFVMFSVLCFVIGEDKPIEIPLNVLGVRPPTNFEVSEIPPERLVFETTLNKDETLYAQNESQREEACLALVIYLEARSESNSSRVGHGYVVMNRLKFYGAPDVCSVVQSSNAFEPIRGHNLTRIKNISRGKNVNISFNNAIEHQAFYESREIARMILSGEVENNVGNATHFYADKTQRQLGRKPPRWSNALEPITSMGQVNFYSEYGVYSGKLVKYTRERPYSRYMAI